MALPMKPRENARSWWERVRNEFWSALADDPLQGVLGRAVVDGVGVSACLFLETIFALQTVDSWLKVKARQSTLIGTISQPAAPLGDTILIVVVWVFVFAWMFRHLGWPKRWAVPYVLGILCSSAWYFQSRLPDQLPLLFLLTLQVPITALFLRQVHRESRTRGERP